MQRKTPGNPNQPVSQAEFDKLDLKRFCVPVRGIFYRVHGLNPSTGKPFEPLHFSRRKASRFDPAGGPGTLHLGKSLTVALMEVFDDSWGPIGSSSRSLSATQLYEWWVTLVWVPQVMLFDARGQNPSKIGTDQQLVTGRHSTSRRWALRLVRHPSGIDGILYPSRHSSVDWNVALFRKANFLPERFDASLDYPVPALAAGATTDKLAYGSALQLARHPQLRDALVELEVSILP
ncbi:MAG TPA: RES family NAD+ phosphorylase [Candidatus Acidoferrum sp.]|jgi:hypothetical protein|nr:RES family NAD+ phosphorylase [Candidatus Acidoferrum sp.]